MRLLLSFIVTLLIIFVVPIVVYGIFSTWWGLKEPAKKLSFMLGVLLQKIGTAVGFVGLFYMAKAQLVEHWLTYSALWLMMFALTEIGQTVMSDYSKKEALAGVISELIYFPLAGLALATILG